MSIAAGDHEKGRREIAESLARDESCGDPLGAAWSRNVLGIAAFVMGDYAEASSYLRQSASQFETLDARYAACHTQVDLGLSLRHEGELPAALSAYREALSYQREYRFVYETADTLDGLAPIAAALGHLDLAAKLFGTAAGWRETYPHDPWFPMPNDFHKAAASVRRRLGERAWLEAYQAGVKLNSEQALEFAEDAVFALEQELQRRSAGLTAREVEVLQLVADGLSNAEIADRLVLSQRTVHAHLRSIELHRSHRFYRDMLGLAIYREFDSRDAPGLVFFLRNSILEVSGRSSHPPGDAMAIWIQVRDVHGEHRRQLDAGVPIFREPRHEVWG